MNQLLKKILLLAIPLSNAAVSARGEVFNGVEFPGGARSFVDSVWRFDPEFSGGLPLENWDPGDVLGPPIIYDSQTLGDGGLIELQFDDNVLATSGDGSSDLFIGEGPGNPESVYVAVRPISESLPYFESGWDDDGDGFFELGRFVSQPQVGVTGYVIFVDVDQAFQEVPTEKLLFDAIQLRDDPDDDSGSPLSDGFELLSIAAMANIERELEFQVGDADNDGDVDLDDLNAVRNRFGAEGGEDSPMLGDAYPYDLDVDLEDLNAARNHFGAVASMSVAEPSAFALITLCSVIAATGMGNRNQSCEGRPSRSCV